MARSKRKCTLNVDYTGDSDDNPDIDDLSEAEPTEAEPIRAAKKPRASRKDNAIGHVTEAEPIRVAKKPRASRKDNSSGNSAWDPMFERLLAYRDKNGNCNVGWKDSDSKLANWVKAQRRFYNKQVLSADRIQRLNSIGFVWRSNRNRADIRWDTMFESLQAYRDQHGNCNVSSRYSDSKLADWVKSQRGYHNKQVLQADRVQRLNSVGFAWRGAQNTDNLNAQWLEKFEKLKAFKTKEGHTNAPRTHGVLGLWVKIQRKVFKEGAMRKDRMHLLASIGFEWQGQPGWNQHTSHDKPDIDEPKIDIIPLLEQWKRLEGGSIAGLIYHHSTIPDGDLITTTPLVEESDESQDGVILVTTASGSQYRLGEAEPAKVFDVVEEETEEDIQEEDLSEAEPTEAEKPRAARKLRKDNTSGSVAEIRWNTLFKRLMVYRDKHGSCWVPCHYKADTELGYWAQKQRLSYKLKKMQPDRIKRFNSIGMVWSFSKTAKQDEQWLENFEKLKIFKKETGHTRVPKVPKDRDSLGRWVAWQRGLFRTGKLTNYRLDLLNSIGFEWQVSLGRYSQSVLAKKQATKNKKRKRTDAVLVAVTSHESAPQATVDPAPPVDLDSLTDIVNDLSDKLDESGATREIHKCEKYLSLMIKNAAKGRDDTVENIGEDAFCRLVPLVDCLVSLLNVSVHEDVNTFLKCKRFLLRALDKAKKAAAQDVVVVAVKTEQ